MEYIGSSEAQAFLDSQCSKPADLVAAEWDSKYEEFIRNGIEKNATFALHCDMLRHMNEVVAVSLAERLGGSQGYQLLLSVIKSSLPFSFVNGATCYAPYCVQLLHTHYSAGLFHQNMKMSLFSTPVGQSKVNYASDTKREIDHISAVKAFRPAKNMSSVIKRMSDIDHLNEIQREERRTMK